MLNRKSNYTRYPHEGNDMKRLTIALAALLLLLGGVFFWLLAGSSDANAPADVTVIDLPDTYEK